MRIYYCEKCETRLTEEELDAGKAFRDAGERVYCAGCAPESLRHPARAPAKKSPARQSSAGLHAVTSAPPSSRKKAEAPNKSFPIWALAAGGVPVFGLLLYALGVFGSAPKPRPAPEPIIATATDAPPAARPEPKARPADAPETARPHSVFDEMAKEHGREFDPERAKALGAKRLESAKQFAQKNPGDPWTYLDMLREIPSGTPAADDAARIILALKVPVDKTETPGWRRDWSFANEDSKTQMLYDFDGRKNVLRTVPLNHDTDLVFARKMAVPTERAHLTLAVRCDDKAVCKVAVEIDGKQQLLEDLQGPAWRAFDLDLSALKGKEASVRLVHVGSSPSSAKAYWAPPVFRAEQTPASTPVAFNNTAPAYVKCKPPAMPKRAFVAPVAWNESVAWKAPIDLLAQANLKTGTVSGTWTKGEKGELQTVKASPAKLAIAYKFPEQYDIRATFERKSGDDDAALVLSHGGKPFVWMMGAEKNRAFALIEVGGKKFEGNPACQFVTACLKNGQRYTTVVEVRKDRISAYLDGKLIVEWTADMGELIAAGNGNNWKLPEGKPLGIGAWQSDVTFYSLEVVEVK